MPSPTTNFTTTKPHSSNSYATIQTLPTTNISTSTKPGETVKTEQGSSEVSQSVEEFSETPTTSGAQEHHACVWFFALVLQNMVFFE